MESQNVTEAFTNFFKPYSRNVDKAESVGFWKLSDRIVSEILRKHISFGVGKVILDAGGGTGRWSIRGCSFGHASFVLYDLSEDMLDQARRNIDGCSLSHRISLVQGDLEDMSEIPSASVDAIFSLYAPLGFVANKERAVRELARILKPGGTMILMGHGYHNSIAAKSSSAAASGEEIHSMAERMRVKWAEFVPELHTFSQESMTKLMTEAGLEVPCCYGIPVCVQPGPEDFDPTNTQRSRISRALDDDDYFESLVSLEMSMNAQPSVVNRGMNILGVGIKR